MIQILRETERKGRTVTDPGSNVVHMMYTCRNTGIFHIYTCHTESLQGDATHILLLYSAVHT